MDNNQNLRQVLQLTGEMLNLADTGDRTRTDYGCGIIYGTLRDTAYKIRKMVEKEIESHETGNSK
jgi:hypothetical protein